MTAEVALAKLGMTNSLVSVLLGAYPHILFAYPCVAVNKPGRHVSHVSYVPRLPRILAFASEVLLIEMELMGPPPGGTVSDERPGPQ